MGDLNFMLNSKGGIPMPTQPILKGARLVLRPLDASDAGLIALYAGDARVASNLAVVPHPYPPGAAEAFIAQAQTGGPAQPWAMEYSANGQSELIGVISLKDEGAGVGMIGYWVAPQLWGGGFASEAADLVIGHAKALGFHLLRATVHQGNDASAKVLTKVGFRYIGEGEEHSMYHKGMVENWQYELEL